MGEALITGLVKFWLTSAVWLVEKELCWQGKQGCSLGIGMRWEKFLLSQGIKKLLELASCSPHCTSPNGRELSNFPQNQAVSSANESGSCFSMSRKRGKKKKITELRNNKYLHSGKDIFSTCGQDLNLTNCLI